MGDSGAYTIGFVIVNTIIDEFSKRSGCCRLVGANDGFGIANFRCYLCYSSKRCSRIAIV